ncbi:hypothetical protein EYF80_008870 [Liparis tanakae]|uniref:Uncharacterized protein n=1 Tax=Liparis tanakae TaxID=230148 RepID=A0A4Z2ISJ2_9TELE|nr:hypothetical protein EYF80_008870 [Liparis tanakae]
MTSPHHGTSSCFSTPSRQPVDFIWTNGNMEHEKWRTGRMKSRDMIYCDGHTGATSLLSRLPLSRQLFPQNCYFSLIIVSLIAPSFICICSSHCL